jgi:2-polyprenyl-6-hydroxyphenyl methylase/3-demethylubiquinone-9 3-methyltransferase
MMRSAQAEGTLSAPTQFAPVTDFDPAALADRHERQYSLLRATGQLGEPPFRVLDLGCGNGATAVWAARRGWRVTAVDNWSQTVSVLGDQLKREPDLPIELVLDDATTCQCVADDTYDLAYLKDLLEHVVDYKTCLASAYRKLRRGGLLYIATTNVICPIQLEYHGVGPYSWYPRQLKQRIRQYAVERKPSIILNSPCPALHWFSRRTLRKALIEAGFRKTWDLYDLVRRPVDLTRRTRVVFPLIRTARFLPFGRDLVDVFVVGLTMVAQK